MVDSLDTSSFINAFRWFLAIRGPFKTIRSDRGANFVSACKELKISSNLDNAAVQNYLKEQELLTHHMFPTLAGHGRE